MELNINEDDLNLMEQIVLSKALNKDEVFAMQQLIRKYIDHTALVCSTCPAQVRFAHTRLTNWYNKMILGQ